MAGTHQFIYIPTLIDRHGLIADLIVRCMKRNRQRKSQILFGQLINFFYHAAGRKRKMTQAQIISFRHGKQTHKAQNIVIIVQWFTNTHQYHIADALSTVTNSSIDLIKHFGRFKRTHQSRQCGRTEFATHSATNLCGNTERITMFVLHKNRFDAVLILQFQKIFHCAVQLGFQTANNFQGIYVIVLLQYST